MPDPISIQLTHDEIEALDFALDNFEGAVHDGFIESIQAKLRRARFKGTHLGFAVAAFVADWPNEPNSDATQSEYESGYRHMLAAVAMRQLGIRLSEATELCDELIDQERSDRAKGQDS